MLYLLATLLILALLIVWIRAGRVRESKRAHFERLPHGEQAILVHEIQEVQPNRIRLGLRPSHGQLRPAECLLEAVAQGAGLLMAHQSSGAISQKSGLLVLVQDFRVVGDAHLWNAGWSVEVTSYSEPRPGILKFSGAAEDSAGRRVMSATLAIYVDS